MKFKEILKKIPFLVKLKKNYDIYMAFRNDQYKFKKYWIGSNNKDISKNGYSIMLEVHSLEKGMTSENPRPFGKYKILSIIKNLNSYSNYNKDFYYNLGVSAIFSYCKFYKEHNWTENNEYKIAFEYLKNVGEYHYIPVGSYELFKDDFIVDSKIDYEKFLKSRHSVRNFKSERIKSEDARNAVKMASLTPTACNRQMCKIYYINDEIKRKEVIKYGKGLTNFNLDTVNIFLVTYDISSFCCVGDRNQGYFNAGLVSMNFVNSLHSLGIGSCFIQFGNNYSEEKELKEYLNIPDSQKIAVMVAAGYYADSSKIPYSSRKEIEDIYFQI